MDDVEAAADWLKRERTALNWSTTDVARRAREIAGEIGDPIKLTQQSISHFENRQAKSIPRWLRYVRHAVELGKLSPQAREVRRSEIFEEYGLNPNGTSEQWLSGEERAWLRMMPRTPARDPGDAAAAAEVFAQQLDQVMLPRLEIGYSMGGGSVFEDYHEVGRMPFPREWLRPLMRGSFAELFLAKGEGDSMMPTLLDGDDVIIDTAQKQISQQDRIWAVAYGDLGMIKRVRRLPGGTYQLNSDNPAVTPIEANDDEMHVVGRVVWVGRRI